MASRREGLRPLEPKPPKRPPLKNSEKCKMYRERLQLDPAKNHEAVLKKFEANKRYRNSVLSDPEKREKAREKARERQRKRRELLKQQKTPDCQTPLKKCKTVTETPPVQTRKQIKKLEEKRERNRLSQQKRRQNMSSQKKRRELERQRRRYKEKKEESSGSVKRKLSLSKTLFRIKETLKDKRSKFSLWKREFAMNLLQRQNETVQKDFSEYYKRKKPARHANDVKKFLEKEGIDIPCKKGASEQKKVLIKTMHTLYKEFHETHEHAKVSFTTFKRLRPSNILLSSSRKFEQYLCEKCVNVTLCLEALDKITKGCPKNVHELVKETLCLNYNNSCIDRSCDKCGIDNFMSLIRSQVDGEKLIMWSRWEKTEKSRKELVKKQTTINELLEIFESDGFKISRHYKNAEWQRLQYQALRSNLHPKHAMCTVDFSENYLCKFQNEMQSAHWSYRQKTVHPSVFFYKCPDGCQSSITEYLVFLSDDLKHSSDFTHLVLLKCVQKMKDLGMEAIHIFSDGCAGQYKSRFAFKNMEILQNEVPDIVITRHFFGASHGKSLCDSSGGVVKNSATKVVVSGSRVIQSAQEMFDFCLTEMTVEADDCPHRNNFLRAFELVCSESIQSLRNSQAPQIPGIQTVHSMYFNSGSMNVRTLSCFCRCCLSGDGLCPNKELTGEWSVVGKSSIKKSDDTSDKCQQICKQNDDLPPVVVDSRVVAAVALSNDGIVEIANESLECTAHQIGILDNVSELESCIDRKECFSSLLNQLSECSTFQQFKSCLTDSAHLNSYQVPVFFTRRVVDVGVVDSFARTLVPDFVKPLLPVSTIADGNCVPRALSLHVFGDQDHHEEIRCRIISELFLNSLDYLSLDVDDRNLIHLLSDSFCSDFKTTFENETLKTAQNASYMGMWQLMAAANVFHCSILSVYPKLGIEKYRKFFTRALKPRENNTKNSLALFWSSTPEHHELMPDEHWTANHIVPLMGLDKFIDIDTDEF